MAKKQVVQDLELKKSHSEIECEDCVKNKGKAVPHKTRSTARAEAAGTSLHLDTAGPMSVSSLGGSRYFVLCKDEASSFRKAAFLESKDEIPAAVKAIIQGQGN